MCKDYGRKGKRSFPIVFFLILLAPLLSGSDGRIDILPDGQTTLNINTPGSYVLVGDVNMKADVTCININTPDVTLDLGGHTITSKGGGTSIAAGIYGVNRVTVHGGRINSFGGTGIILGEAARVYDLVVAFNGHTGVFVKDRSHVYRVQASNNGATGIYASNNCHVKDCIAEANNKQGKNAGIKAGDSCTILDNVCTDNVSATTFPDNWSCGISAGSHCLIRNNTCARNNATGTQLLAMGTDDRSNVAF